MEDVTAQPAPGMFTVTDERAEWLAWRRHGIGGSDIAALLGLSRYGSPWTVWADKVGVLPEQESTERQLVGRDLEIALDRMFHRKTGLYVGAQQVWVTCEGAPHRRCTLDGLAFDHPVTDSYPVAEGALGIVEHKSDWRRAWPDGPPPEYRAQAIWNMGVSEQRYAWLNVLHGGFRHEVYEVPWDDDAARDWEYMCDVADRFWREHVVTGIAPPIDGSDATTDALKVAYPAEEPGARAALDAGIVRRWDAARGLSKTAHETLKGLANDLRAQFGDAEIGTVDGRAVLTYRQQPGRAHTCSACGNIDRGEPFRVLREAPKKLRDLPAVTP